MKLSRYTSSELNIFASVLDAAANEAISKHLDLSIKQMARRMFDAARKGERDPYRLRAAIFQEPPPVPLPSARRVA